MATRARNSDVAPAGCSTVTYRPPHWVRVPDETPALVDWAIDPSEGYHAAHAHRSADAAASTRARSAEKTGLTR
jgi:hypothetical protein